MQSYPFSDRLQTANDEDKATLEPELFALLIDAHRDDEALQLLDAAIAERPNEVLSPTDCWAYDRHDDPDERLKLIDFALERARRIVATGEKEDLDEMPGSLGDAR